MRRAVLAVAGAAVLWSSGGLFIKLAPMPALAVACGRSLIAGVFYLLVVRPNLRAARWTTAANAIFLQYTGPAYVLLLSPFLLDEPFRPIDAVCVALSLAGMSLFFVGKVEPGQAFGNVVAIASGVFFALAIVLLRRDAKGGSGDALPSTTLGNLLAAALTAPWAWQAAPSMLSVQGAAVLLYLGIVQLGLAYLLFTRGVRRVPAAEASLISMLEPVLNPLWVLIGFGERPGPWAIAGGAVVIAAVVVRTLLPQPQRASTTSV